MNIRIKHDDTSAFIGQLGHLSGRLEKLPALELKRILSGCAAAYVQKYNETWNNENHPSLAKAAIMRSTVSRKAFSYKVGVPDKSFNADMAPTHAVSLKRSAIRRWILAGHWIFTKREGLDKHPSWHATDRWAKRSRVWGNKYVPKGFLVVKSHQTKRGWSVHGRAVKSAETYFSRELREFINVRLNMKLNRGLRSRFQTICSIEIN